MNALASISAAQNASDDRLDVTGGLYAFALFFLGYAYSFFYFYLLTVGGT